MDGYGQYASGNPQQSYFEPSEDWVYNERGELVPQSEYQGTPYGQPGAGPVLTPPSTEARKTTTPLSYGGNLNYPAYTPEPQGDKSLALLETGGDRRPQGLNVLPPPPVSGQSSTGMPIQPYKTGGLREGGNVLSAGGNVALAASPTSGSAAPFVAAAGGVMKVGGEAMKLIAAGKEKDQAEAEYKELMKEWKKAKRREEADYQRELERQALQDKYYKGAQSAALEDRFASAYGGYRQGGQ